MSLTYSTRDAMESKGPSPLRSLLQASTRMSSAQSRLHAIDVNDSEAEQETWLTGPADAQLALADKPDQDADQVEFVPYVDLGV